MFVYIYTTYKKQRCTAVQEQQCPDKGKHDGLGWGDWKLCEKGKEKGTSHPIMIYGHLLQTL